MGSQRWEQGEIRAHILHGNDGVSAQAHVDGAGAMAQRNLRFRERKIEHEGTVER